MKKMKLFAAAAAIVAAGSAFATNSSLLAPGDYNSTKADGQNCQPTSGTLNQPLCRGTNGTCKIGNVTYYSDAQCAIPLQFN